MKGKVFTIKISIALLILSLVFIGISFLVCNNTISLLLNSLGFGILGSCAVTLAVSIGEYHNEKRIALEDYYSEAYRIVGNFSKIRYCDCNEEKDLLIAYEREQKSNKMWNSLFKDQLRNEHTEKDKLIDFYKKNGLCSESYTAKQVEGLIFVRKKIAFDSIDETVDSYLELSKTSLKELENAYGRICFFTKGGNKKYRDDIYKNLHNKLREMLHIIVEASFHFDNYKSGKETGIGVVYDKIKELSQKLFEETEMKTTLNGFDYSSVNATFVTQLRESLEDLRSLIYNDEKGEIKPTIIYTKTINRETKENV